MHTKALAGMGKTTERHMTMAHSRKHRPIPPTQRNEKLTSDHFQICPNCLYYYQKQFYAPPL
jgi:hypothetical protein